MTKKELSCIGAMIYACEGTKMRKDKRHKNTFFYAMEVTNSNPLIIATFILFMTNILKIDKSKIRYQLFTYDHEKEKLLIKYWASIMKTSPEYFQKTILLTAKGSIYKPNPLGTLKIRYTNKHDFLKLQRLIDEVLFKACGINKTEKEVLQRSFKLQGEVA